MSVADRTITPLEPDRHPDLERLAAHERCQQWHPVGEESPVQIRLLAEGGYELALYLRTFPKLARVLMEASGKPDYVQSRLVAVMSQSLCHFFSQGNAADRAPAAATPRLRLSRSPLAFAQFRYAVSKRKNDSMEGGQTNCAFDGMAMISPSSSPRRYSPQACATFASGDAHFSYRSCPLVGQSAIVDCWAAA